MKLLIEHPDLFLHDPCYRLGELSSTLEELSESGRLANSPDELAKLGYRKNRRAGGGSPLLELTAPLFLELMGRGSSPLGLIVHHCFASSSSEAWNESDPSLMGRAAYFPAALLRRAGVDDLPYFGSFATGCAGLVGLVLAGRGILSSTAAGQLICLTGDVVPQGVHYDAAKERFLTSDVCSGFLLSRQPRGLRVAGVSFYSSSRAVIASVEIVKRTVEMAEELCESCNVDPRSGQICFHFPNLFLPVWDMVRRYLKYPAANHVVEGIGDRAHCLSSDGIITLCHQTAKQRGGWHCIVSFGSGLHLGLCLFEQVTPEGTS